MQAPHPLRGFRYSYVQPRPITDYPLVPQWILAFDQGPSGILFLSGICVCITLQQYLSSLTEVMSSLSVSPNAIHPYTYQGILGM